MMAREHWQTSWASCRPFFELLVSAVSTISGTYYFGYAHARMSLFAVGSSHPGQLIQGLTLTLSENLQLIPRQVGGILQDSIIVV